MEGLDASRIGIDEERMLIAQLSLCKGHPTASCAEVDGCGCSVPIISFTLPSAPRVVVCSAPRVVLPPPPNEVMGGATATGGTGRESCGLSHAKVRLTPGRERRGLLKARIHPLRPTLGVIRSASVRMRICPAHTRVVRN